MKPKDLDDTIFTTPTGKDYLTKEFTDATVEMFERAIELRRAIMAKNGAAATSELALNEV